MEDEDHSADPLFDVKIEINDDSSHKEYSTHEGGRSSFKIIQTIENGKLCLWTVPQAWERDGLLQWPRFKVEKLRRNPNSQPLDNWQVINCILKKTDLQSFEFSETLIRLMTDASDNEDIDSEEPVNGDKILPLTSYALAQKHVQSQRYSQANTRKPTEASVENEQGMEDFANILVIPADNYRSSSFQPKKIVLKAAVTSDNTGTTQISEINSKINSLCTYMSAIAQDQQVLVKNQEIIMNKMMDISQRVDSSFTNDIETEQSMTFTTGTIASGPLKPISDHKSLDELEESLKDKQRAAELKKKYSVICGYGKGRAITNAYVLLDVMFERRFLLQCSWAGGSRTSDSKVCFKSYVNVIDFFFQVIHSSDKRFTMIECHAFFQKILRNAKKRSEAKRMRASGVRHRRKRMGNVLKSAVENREDNSECPGSESEINESLNLNSNNELHFLL